MNFPFYIAKRYLIAKKSRNAINIISWISVVSIAIGTFALVVVLSVFNGLEQLVESLFESFDADIKITAAEGKVFSEDDIDLDQLTSMEGVADYTRVLEEVCGARYQEQQSIVTLKGVDENFLAISGMDSMLVNGEAILKDGEIEYGILGYGIATNLGLFLNQNQERIAVYAPKRGRVSIAQAERSFYRKSIYPAGIFYISPEFDYKYMLVSLEFMRSLLKYEKELTAIEVNTLPGTDLEKLQQSLSAALGDQFEVQSRYQYNALIYKTNQTEKWVTFLILVFILIIAAFNILSSLTMLIIDKKEDIQTLRSLGASNATIRSIFFTEGLLINLSGALSGLLFGTLVCWVQQTFGLLRLEGGIVEYYPVQMKAIEVVYIFFTVLIIGLLTSWYPVRVFTKKQLS